MKWSQLCPPDGATRKGGIEVSRRVYFAFNYEDVRNFRVNVIRNSNAFKPKDVFMDASLWEKTKRKSDDGIKRIINEGLKGTTVTAVLIGDCTYKRRWVRYEIFKSLERGNGLLGVYLHNILDKAGKRARGGPNPFEYLGFNLRKGTLHERVLGGLFWPQSQDVPNVPLHKLSYDFAKYGTPTLAQLFQVYDWVKDDGYNQFADWVEDAAQQAGKR